MPGKAKTDTFLLSTATVMLGAQADLYKLNNAHALGLVKNVAITSEVSSVDMTQGIQNDVVLSVKNGDTSRVTAEVYEYTAKNVAYAAALEGADAITEMTETAVTSTSSASGSSTLTVATNVTTQFPVGSWIVVKQGNDEHLHVAKVAAIAFSTTTTITITGYEIPTGVTIPVGATIYKVNSMMIGGGDTHPAYSCKIVGFLPSGGRPVAILLPKVKVMRGMNLSFQSDNFANMPFEIQPYSLVTTDPHYAIFGSKKWQMVM